MKKQSIRDYTDDEIYAELERREISAKEIEYKTWHTKVSEKGVKVSDLLIIEYKLHEKDDRSLFGVALKKQWKKGKYLNDTFEKYCDWASLLPDEFSEVLENGNVFDGTDEEARALLKKCGFEVIKYSWGN